MTRFEKVAVKTCIAILIACALYLTYTVSHAARTIGSFGSVNVQVEGTDTVCASYTSAISGSSVVATCNPTSSSPPPGAPTGCIAKLNGGTVNVVLPSSGGQVALSVTCASPSIGLSYSWKRNSSAGVNTTASWSDNFGPNASTTTDIVTTYQVTVCVSATCVTVPAAAIAVITSHIVTTAWNGVCAGFDKTIAIDVDWTSPTRKFTASYGGMNPNDIIVVRFTTGNIDSTASNLPRVTAAEYNSPPSSRIGVLSNKPCDFGPPLLASGAYNAGNSMTSVFAVGSGPDFGYYPRLAKQTTYYFNIKNNQGSTCFEAPSCDMFVDLIKSNL